jgi:chemotaxis signal transduction protein
MSINDTTLQSSVPDSCGLREFVIGRVGGTHVAIPAERVESVIDAKDGSEPPCDELWVAGWFLHRDRLWLSVRLDGRDVPRATVAKRLVIRESDHLRFAIEVDELLGSAVLDDVGTAPFDAEGWSAPSEWLRRGEAYDGRPVCCVDVDAITAHLLDA